MNITPLDLAQHLQPLTPQERLDFIDIVNLELEALNVPFQLAGKPEQQGGDPGDKWNSPILPYLLYCAGLLAGGLSHALMVGLI